MSETDGLQIHLLGFCPLSAFGIDTEDNGCIESGRQFPDLMSVNPAVSEYSQVGPWHMEWTIERRLGQRVTKKLMETTE